MFFRFRLPCRRLRLAVSGSDGAVACTRSLCTRSNTGDGRNQEVIGERRFVRAAIIGSPNAGKTTLVNHLLGQKVFAVSPKVHTTNRRTLGVFTDGDTQVVLLDTPGVIPYQYGRKLRLSKAFMADPHRSLTEAELVVVIVDASTKRTRRQLDPNVVQVLRSNPRIPSALVLNKVDLIRHKHVLLGTADALTGHQEAGRSCKGEGEEEKEGEREKEEGERKGEGEQEKEGKREGEKEEELRTDHASWPDFKEVFMISALTGDGVEDLRDYVMSCARPGEWEYSTEEVTDQPALHLVEDIVREKMLLHLRKEIPYTVIQENVIWEEEEGGALTIYQNLTCKSSSQASIVIGPAGRTIQTITTEAKEDIEALLKRSVDLTLNVRTRRK